MCAEGRGRSAEASPSRKGLRKLMSVRGNPCVVFEALSRKQIPKFSRKTFAEAAAEGGSKKDYKRSSRKGFAEGVVSVLKLYKNRTTAQLVLDGCKFDFNLF